MKGVPERGDVVIRQGSDGRYELLDAETRASVATSDSFTEALSIAARQSSGAVWREIIDHRGRLLGDPMLVLPRVR